MSFNRDCILDDGRIVSIPGKGAKDHIVGYLGEVDYAVHVMRVDGADGAPACFIVNYANHPDNDNTKRTHFSSDYPGFLRENLKMIFGRDVTVLFLNGACGDVNAYNYASGVSEKYAYSNTYMPEEMAKLLTETVCAINSTIKASESAPAVRAAVRTDTYKRRAPADWEVEKALAVKARADAGERLYLHERSVMEKTLAHGEGPGGVFTHFGTVVKGTAAVDAEVTAIIDTERREAIRRNHTAAHLLQAALRKTLGNHVEQAGQYVDQNAVRFDFTHFSALTSQELENVQNLVNNAILSAVDVVTEVLPIAEAKKRGAMALFGEKYGDTVRTVTAGEFSVELCGGTHVANTANIGLFKIISESSVASGVRRIEAVTGLNLLNLLEKYEYQVIW